MITTHVGSANPGDRTRTDLDQYLEIVNATRTHQTQKQLSDHPVTASRGGWVSLISRELRAVPHPVASNISQPRMYLDAHYHEHHDVFMRTTLTLDDDVTRLLEEEMHRRRKSFKDIVNEAIRRGLSPQGIRSELPPYRVRPHQTAFQPGLDRAALNRLADELEDDAALATWRTA